MADNMMVAVITIVLFYVAFLLMLIIAWSRLQPIDGVVNEKISVVIAVRNEERNIQALLSSLLRQRGVSYEIILVDDGSDDGTLAMAQTIANEKLIVLKSEGVGKKAALAKGVSVSSGDIIVCTDGDCTMSQNWLKSMTAPFVRQEVKMVSGPVVYKASHWFEKLQQIEFASLIGTGAATIKMKKPTMCNGANIAYRKKAFENVKGYKGNEHLASGDDEFLMHKLFKKYGIKALSFQKSKEALVETAANKSFSSFFHQRKRWASKWGSYQLAYVQTLAVAIFLIHLFYPTILILGIANVLDIKLVLLLYGIKILLEGVFIGRVLTFMKVKKHVLLFFVVEFFYDFYVILFAMISWGRGYKWKERPVR